MSISISSGSILHVVIDQEYVDMIRQMVLSFSIPHTELLNLLDGHHIDDAISATR